MSEEQKMQVPARWNGFTSDYPRDRCIHELFEEIAHTKPFELALIFADIRLTYGELNARANQIAHYLRSFGVGPDVLVGICFERGIEMIVAMLAILKAGGAYVPLDPRYPPDRLAFLIADTALGTILSDHALRTKLPAKSANQFTSYPDCSMRKARLGRIFRRVIPKLRQVRGISPTSYTRPDRRAGPRE